MCVGGGGGEAVQSSSMVWHFRQSVCMFRGNAHSQRVGLSKLVQQLSLPQGMDRTSPVLSGGLLQRAAAVSTTKDGQNQSCTFRRLASKGSSCILVTLRRFASKCLFC